MPSKPRDRREYVRISVTLPGHPKLARLDSPSASWLYIVGICWCGEHLTDGHVQPRVVERIAGVARRWTAELVRVGLWHGPDHDCPVCPQPAPGQMFVHDFLRHQRSRDESNAARVSARAAASARWDAKGNAEGMRSAYEEQCPIDAEVEVEEEKFKTKDKTNPPISSRSAPPPSRPGTRLPDDFAVSPGQIDWARTKCPDVPASEHEAFVDYWRSAVGTKARKADWEATWRTWMRRAQADITAGRRAPATGKRSTTDDRVAAGLALAARYDLEDGTGPTATVHHLAIGGNA